MTKNMALIRSLGVDNFSASLTWDMIFSGMSCIYPHFLISIFKLKADAALIMMLDLILGYCLVTGGTFN